MSEIMADIKAEIMASIAKLKLSCILKILKPTVIKSVAGTTKVSFPPEPIVRRSGNYKPCTWDNNFLQSLKTEYRTWVRGEAIDERASELKEEVRLIFNNVVKPLDQLELIDQLQRLGLDYHFHDKNNCTLKNIHTGQNNEIWEKDLHATALEFRLLRQHGHYISLEGFKRFTENGSFKKGESLMEEAWSFTTKSLGKCLEKITDLDLQVQVRHALELPLQWSVPTFDARQALYRQELKDLSRWWSRLDIGKKLPFARDRLVASFFWSLGTSGEAHHKYCREVLTKIIELIGVYDDVYDIYGTLDELECFTDAVERWDITAMEDLPDYMKSCFLSLYNFFNDLFKSHLTEARWYHSGYQPRLEEYLNNGLVSIAGPIGVLYSYICTADPIKKEEIEFIQDRPDIVRLGCEILRLTDDMEPHRLS
ncbi:(-)-alpha-terpineol synthase [Heracleum sosnowskyi]|uniref:(-)-alpha-terpineol synthase n=1 Tax=Heracleum sosnowskyi TaxID=360622 RepID=A0AAD8HLR0_9APIA|nr:(-)-alpha-terpineol synthase [Heracleum sosnowskyi]